MPARRQCILKQCLLLVWSLSFNERQARTWLNLLRLRWFRYRTNPRIGREHSQLFLPNNGETRGNNQISFSRFPVFPCEFRTNGSTPYSLSVSISVTLPLLSLRFDVTIGGVTPSDRLGIILGVFWHHFR